MPSSGRNRNRRVPVPSSHPISAQMCLYQHWRVRTEVLKRLAASAESIVLPSRNSESVAEWMQQSQERICPKTLISRTRYLLDSGSPYRLWLLLIHIVSRFLEGTISLLC
jgi:hypothetical protein